MVVFIFRSFAKFGLLSTFMGILVTFVNIPLYLNYLGIQNYGEWVLLNSVGLLVTIIGVGMPQVVLKFVSEDPEGFFVPYARISLIITLFQIAVLGALVFIGKNAIFHIVGLSKEIDIVRAYFYFSIAWIVGLCVNVTNSLLFATSRHRFIYICNMAFSIAGLILNWIVLSLGGGIFGLSVVLMLLSSFRLVPNLIPILKIYKANSSKKMPRTKWRPILSNCITYGFYQLVGQVSFGIIFNLDNIIAARFTSVSEMVFYSFRLKIFQNIITLTGQPFWNYIPIISRKNYQRDFSYISDLFLKVLKLSFSVVGVIAIFFVFNIEHIVYIWTNTSIPVNLVLDIEFGLLLLVEQYVLNLSVVTAGLDVKANRFFTMLSVIESVLNVTLTIYLTARLSLIGVVLGTLIPRIFVTLLFMTFHIRKKLDLRLANFLPAILYPSSLGLLLILVIPYISYTVSDGKFVYIMWLVFSGVVALGLMLLLSLDGHKRNAILAEVRFKIRKLRNSS